MPWTSRRSQRLLASQGGTTSEHHGSDFGGTTVGVARRKHPSFPQAPPIDTMQHASEPVARTGGQFFARIVAVVLALGVLGYLMWRSQSKHGASPEISQGATPLGEGRDFDPANLPDPHPMQPDDRANIIELPPMLHSSKSAMIEESPAPAERTAGSSSAETPPAPETPR